MLIKFIILICLSYFIGAIPFSYLIAKIFRNIDLRKVGSGSAGATNVYRNCGLPLGVLAFFSDAMKGFMAVFFLVHLLDFPPSYFPGAQIMAFLFVVTGHNWTVFLKFKGGKGIATSAGALVAIHAWAFLLLLAVWSISMVVTKYVSLSSIIVAVFLPVMLWLFGLSHAYVFFGIFIAALAVYRHKDNIKRLLKGQEGKIYDKKKT